VTRIFWDSNLFIYLFEQHPRFCPLVIALRKRMLARGDLLCTSAFTAAEVLVKPSAMGNRVLVDQYRRFFAGTAVSTIPFDLSAAEAYAAIRADRSISRPDAIQLACAAAAGIDLFVTNDAQLHGKIVPGIKFVTSLTRCLF
jgi:predicted nucleic acid-binding protein